MRRSVEYIKGVECAAYVEGTECGSRRIYRRRSLVECVDLQNILNAGNAQNT